MKVLFIRSGNKGLDPISTRQGNSLQKEGITVEFFELIGKGVLGYLSNIKRLRRYIKSYNPDVLHSHYSFSGFLTSLTFTRVPKVVSLMGSDVQRPRKLLRIALWIFMFLWKSTIVKSEELYIKLGNKKALIIPNGIDFNSFYPINKTEACDHLSWSKEKKHILFAADPERPEKNFFLAESALALLNEKLHNFEIHYLSKISMENIVYYYNAADILLLTSTYEGSPNVIKEAMSCNCPIVATNVGDIKWIFGLTEGCYLTSFDTLDVYEKISEALIFSDKFNRTNGRERITQLGLDSGTIAKRLIEVYEKAI